MLDYNWFSVRVAADQSERKVVEEWGGLIKRHLGQFIHVLWRLDIRQYRVSVIC